MQGRSSSNHKSELIYDEKLNYIKSSKFVKSEMSQLNIDESNIELYISYYMLQNLESVDIYTDECAKKNGEMETKNARLLLRTLERVFDKMGIFKSLKRYHNQVLGNDELDNPFLLKPNQINQELTDTDNDTKFEILAKCSFWCNRMTKELEKMKKGSFAKKTTCPKDDKALTLLYNKVRYKTIGKIGEDSSLSQEFLDDYSAYLDDAFSKEEFDDMESLKAVKQIIESENKDNIDFDVEDLYKYMALDNCKDSLYMSKVLFMEHALEELNIQPNPKVTCCVSQDKSLINKNKHDNVLDIFMIGYNAPISVHCEKSLAQNFKKNYKVLQPQEKYTLPRGQDLIVYKYDDEQKACIEEINHSSIYQKPQYCREDIKFAHNMITDPSKNISKPSIER
ncbi:MAG: hypothetical protein RSB76_02265 [Clostridia bacterium]